MDAFDRIMSESRGSSKRALDEDAAHRLRGADGNKRLRWKSPELAAEKVVPKCEYSKKEELDQPWEKWQVSDQQEFLYEGKKYRAVPAEETNPKRKNGGYSRCKFCVFAARKGGGGMSVHCWFVPTCEDFRREDKKFVIFEEVKDDGIDNNR